MIRKHFVYNIWALTVLLSLLTSCSDSDYTDFIPSNCTAVISVKTTSMSGEGSPFNEIRKTFSGNNEELAGIDVTKDILLFETPDGTLGMCAALSDEGDFGDFLQKLKTEGNTDNFVERDGYTFCCLKKSWIVGYNKSAVIVLGPILASDRARTVRRITAWLNQDESASIKHSPLWEHLQEAQSDIRMVAQSSTLPEQIAAALSLGAPKGTDPDDILIEAEITFSDNTMHLKGMPCSYNVNVKQSLQKAQTIYRKLTTDWNTQMDAKAFAGIFMNVNGEELMPYLHNNKALNTMLLGTDAYDKIRDNKEEMAILLSPNGKATDDKNMTAEVRNLPNGKTTSEEHLVVVLNLGAIGNSASDKENIIPLLAGTKRIIYTLKADSVNDKVN